MKVCRIEKDTVLRKVGEVIEPSSFERIYSEMRSKAELLLESVRSEFYPKLFDRVDSLFVFPYDDKMEKRAFQWANTFASAPGSYCIVNLLVLEVDNVEWHDSRNYEDLCFLLGNCKVGMRDKNVNKDDLCNRYWLEKCNMEELSIEGLVKKARVISIAPYIVTRNGIRKLEQNYMDNFNKAKEYADGKVVEELNQVVADAYQAGYNAGYQAGINKVVKDSALEKTEYVDLGLPSGTLWASSYVEDEKGNAIYLTQEESKAYNLPTLEQWDELRRKCKWNENTENNWTEYGNYYYHSWAICLGPNGNKITFELTGLYKEFSHCSQTGEALFWLKDSDGCGRNSAKITLNDLELDTNSTFSGYKLCLRTVK